MRDYGASPAAPPETKECIMDLKGSRTHQNLRDALTRESLENRRYLYFARVADIEGYPEAGALFRETSESDTGHAFGHLEFLRKVGDPTTDLPIGGTLENLKASAAGETYESLEMYPAMAKTAREEGFTEIAEWFETLARAERSHAARFNKAIEAFKEV
jgi:rubrerythrin